jgi:carbon-monoxide dehydrogenase small subunit
MTAATVRLIVNGKPVEATAESRRSLLDFLREDLGLTGSHAGCEQGVCGCCNVILDGALVRSCLTLATDVAGSEVLTVEGLAEDGELSPLQRSFCQHHALQCGYCTPGMLMAAHALLTECPHPTPEQITEALSGTLCRCTGYQQIADAVAAAAGSTHETGANVG